MWLKPWFYSKLALMSHTPLPHPHFTDYSSWNLSILSQQASWRRKSHVTHLILNNILRHHDSDCPPPVLESMENLSSHAGYVRGWVRVMLNDGAIANVLNMLCDGESAELLHFYWVLPNSYVFTEYCRTLTCSLHFDARCFELDLLNKCHKTMTLKLHLITFWDC